MSFHSIHMARGNHVNGIRMMVIVVSYLEVFKGITWGNIAEKLSGLQSYGNTKFVDALITACWFKNYFNIAKTGRDIGYYVNPVGACQGLKYRICRLNIENFYEVFVSLVLNGLIEPSHMRPILTMDLTAVGFSSNIASVTHKGKFFRYFCKRLVMDTLDCVPSVQEQIAAHDLVVKTKVRQAAERLMVPLATIRYWRDQQVEDIMIQR